YLMMGDIVKRFDILFNRLNPDFSNEYLTPTQESRYLQLREELFEKSDFMIMERRQDGSELPKFDDTISYEVSYAAVNLEDILRFYLTSPVHAADTIATYFQPDSDGAGALYGGAFKRSTVEWFEEIKAELIGQGYLGENEDGAMELLIPYS
ncbi:MAG: hypothetical protein K2M15_04255, partial [Oscillospiraceae bacterium]|nr:hypothetical protein [Oscillospiraceae bacterium]